MSSRSLELMLFEWVPILSLNRTHGEYTVLQMVSQYSTDQQVAVTRQIMLQCASKGKEEDCKQAKTIL